MSSAVVGALRGGASDQCAEPRASDAATATFAELLNREILHSERRRVLTLAAALTVIFALILLLLAVAPDLIAFIFRGHIPWRAPLTLFPPFIAYELGVATLLTYFERRGRRYPTIGRYANALIETSFPTLMLILFHTLSLDARAAFASWPVWLYFVFIILSTLRLDFALSAFTGAVAAVELFAIAYFQLDLSWRPDDFNQSFLFHLTRSAVLLASGVFAGLVGRTLERQFKRALAAASARDRVTNLFGQHVSPQVVDRLLAVGASEDGQMRQVCVMFVDIRGFTAAARDRSPAEVVARLEAAFAILVEIVDQHQGVVNKFLGDGFLAMFGAPIEDPSAAAHAVIAAREMLRAIEEDNRDNAWPIRLGIGVHIGEAVTGIVGSPRRKEYTAIGDTVNLASRLEALNKDFGSQLLISNAAWAAAGAAAGEADRLGPVAVRGYAEPVIVWRLA
ncbi:MAG TPA: adenylate/guanylate cyclase domain-containing protein [Roseiarcus sp.]|nr:adenylate/guanylate cyclase domain-containing protein [Roseiarcus sp.]